MSVPGCRKLLMGQPLHLGQFGIRDICVTENGSLQAGSKQVGIDQFGIGHVRAAKVCIYKVSFLELCSCQVSFPEVRIAKNRPAQIHSTKIRWKIQGSSLGVQTLALLPAGLEPKGVLVQGLGKFRSPALWQLRKHMVRKIGEHCFGSFVRLPGKSIG